MPIVEEVSTQVLSDRLRVKAAELRIPFDAYLEITYGCNFRCIHCYNPTHHALPTELKTPELIAILEQLVDLGCLQVVFTGGEPFTRPDAFELFHAANKIGLQIAINTNAALIDAEKIKCLKQLSLTHLSISVYGMTRETYESVTQIPGSFDRFMQAVELLRESGIPLLFKMPVMTKNVHELAFAREWFLGRSLPFIHSVEIFPRVDGNPAPLEVRLSPDQAAALRLQYEEGMSCAGVGKRAGEKSKLFSCNCGKSSFSVTPYGEMNLCTVNPYPRYLLRSGNIREGWRMLVNFVDNLKPSEKFECPRCEFAPYCTQGAMDAFLNTGDFNPCLPYFKDVARQVKESVAR